MNNGSLSDPIQLEVQLIEVGERLRAVDPDWVALLAANMAEQGQLEAIIVGPADPETGRYPLRAGGHRLAAAKANGWVAIEARVSAATGLQARLEEVDENLMRRELSALDRAVFLAERKAIWEQMHPETRHGGRRESKSTSLSTCAGRFSKATAEKLGLSERSVHRAVRRAELPAEIRAKLAFHPVADSAAELDKLLGLPTPEQIAVADRLTRAEKPARSVTAALQEFKGAPPLSRAAETQKQLVALLGAWRKAGTPARRQFLEFLESEGVATAAPKAAA